MKVLIRGMIRKDLPDVLECQGNGGWEETHFLKKMRKLNTFGVVAEHFSPKHKEKVVAFLIYEEEETFFKILNFAVHINYQQKGIGKRLIAKLQSRLGANGKRKIVSPVPEENLSAQLFFKNLGFKAVSVTRGYYVGGDAYMMEYSIPSIPVEEDTEWAVLLNGTYLPTNRIAHLL